MAAFQVFVFVIQLNIEDKGVFVKTESSNWNPSMPMQICLLYQLTYRDLDLNMDITDRRGGIVMGLSRAVLPDLRGSDPRLHLPGDGPAGRTPSSRTLSGFFYNLFLC